MQKVLLTIPTGDGWIHKLVVAGVMRLLADKRYAVTAIFPTHIPVENNRNACIQDVLKGGYDWWLTIDADNPPRKNPLDLIELGHNIVGCPTPVYHYDGKHPGDSPVYLNAMDEIREAGEFVGWKPHACHSGLQEVDAVGSGCLLVARCVLESLKDEQPFMRSWNKQGIVVAGSDFLFCQKAKAHGHRIWAHYDYYCGHVNEVDLFETTNAFMEMKIDG